MFGVLKEEMKTSPKEMEENTNNFHQVYAGTTCLNYMVSIVLVTVPLDSIWQIPNMYVIYLTQTPEIRIEKSNAMVLKKPGFHHLYWVTHVYKIPIMLSLSLLTLQMRIKGNLSGKMFTQN